MSRSSAGRFRRGQAPALDAAWTSDQPQLSPGQPVTLTTQTADGTRYQIKIAVDDGYLFTIRQSVTNGSGQPTVNTADRAGQPLDQISRSVDLAKSHRADRRVQWRCANMT